VAKTAVQHLSVGAKMMSRMLKEEVTSNREQQGTANEIQNSLLVKFIAHWCHACKHSPVAHSVPW